MVNTGDMSVNPGNTSTLVYKYMRPEHLPHIWCPGCGNGIIMRDVAQAIENLGLSRNKTVIVSGIGCSSRAAGYLDFNTIHTTHGRAIAFATGIKLANPELEVIVLAGDGDISAIGGNHLIHAARRNIGLTVGRRELCRPGKRVSCPADDQPHSGGHSPSGLFDHRRCLCLPDLLWPQEPQGLCS